MKEKEILYLKKNNRAIIVVTQNGESILPVTIETFLNGFCINALTTLQGRIVAIKQKYNIRKNVPIYISHQLFLFSTFNKRDLNNIYINAYNILTIKKDAENNAVIIFKNRSELLIGKKYEIIKSYYEKALIINNDILKKNI